MPKESGNENNFETSENIVEDRSKRLDTLDLGEAIKEDIEEAKQKEENKEEVASKKNNYKYFIYLFVILAITAFVLWFNLTRKVEMPGSAQEVYVYETIGETFSTMNSGFFTMFIGFVFGGYAIMALMIFFYARLYTKHYKYHQAVANTCIGSFYNNITPGASGGQFAQVVTFKKQGIPVSNGASIFVMQFIIHQTVLIIFGIISLITRFNVILSLNIIPITIGEITINIPIWIFIVFGFTLNLLVILVLIFMSYSWKFQHFILNGVIGFLAKIKLIKNPDEKRKDLLIQVTNYRIELRRLLSNIPFALLITFLTFLSMVIFWLAPFFSGLALNGFDMNTTNFGLKAFDCVVFMNFHQMVTGLIPIPGSAGVSELVFSSLFGTLSNYYNAETFYSTGGLNILLLVWRFGTFYIPFIVNGIVAATYRTRGVPVADRIIPVANRKTMLTIQLNTYEERKKTSDYAFETKSLERKELISKLTLKKSTKPKKSSSKSRKKKQEPFVENIEIGEEE
ncbi:MAG: flippase-like domain-containing protein [Bacilli bacterium]|nr:flippase-like domain-containing protein [Bacilli bacterium]